MNLLEKTGLHGSEAYGMACKCISVPFLVWLMIVTGLLLAYNCVHGQGKL